VRRRLPTAPDKPWFDLAAARELSRRAAKRARVQIVVVTPLLGGVLTLYVYRDRLFPRGWDAVMRILLAVAFMGLGWQLAREVGVPCARCSPSTSSPQLRAPSASSSACGRCSSWL
jgi:hypothetical protein